MHTRHRPCDDTNVFYVFASRKSQKKCLVTVTKPQEYSSRNNHAFSLLLSTQIQQRSIRPVVSLVLFHLHFNRSQGILLLTRIGRLENRKIHNSMYFRQKNSTRYECLQNTKLRTIIKDNIHNMSFICRFFWFISVLSRYNENISLIKSLSLLLKTRLNFPCPFLKN